MWRLEAEVIARIPRSSRVISVVPVPGVARETPVPHVAAVTEDDAVWLRIRDALDGDRATVARCALGDGPATGSLDLIVLHVVALERHALGQLRELRRTHGPAVPVVLLCGELGSRAVRRSLDAGCTALVLEAHLERTLAPTVAAAIAGQTSVPREFGVLLRRQPLSFREKQIVGLAALGYTNSQIGSRLYLAESTVKSHLSSSFTKLGINSRSEASALVHDPDEHVGAEIIRIAGQLDQQVRASGF